MENTEQDLVRALSHYIKETYQIVPEHPWRKDPEHMAFKDSASGKWFALVLSAERKKLGIGKTGKVFVVNVKSKPEFIGMISQVNGYCPGYHMNKQHWLTVFLDGSVPKEQIFDRIDESYRLITDSPSRRIYEAVKKIPRGKVATYGQVAAMAGDRKMARAVGNALHKNPDPEAIPCYRVVNAKGELAGAFAFGGGDAQARLLEKDGIEVVNGKVDLKRYGMIGNGE